MGDKEFFIYSDRNELRTPSNTEYRVKHQMKLKDLKPSIKSQSLIIVFQIEINS